MLEIKTNKKQVNISEEGHRIKLVAKSANPGLIFFLLVLEEETILE